MKFFQGWIDIMIKKDLIRITICILIIVTITIIFSCFLNKPQGRDYPEITIRHLQYFDSSTGNIKAEREKGISSGDFQWQSTIYKNKSIGSISGIFVISVKPYSEITVSRLKKVQDIDFDKISRKNCSEIKYEESDVFINANEGDTFCIAMDKNRDGTYGDGYLKLKIISHRDSKEGKYADSMTFIYKIL